MSCAVFLTFGKGLALRLMTFSEKEVIARCDPEAYILMNRISSAVLRRAKAN